MENENINEKDIYNNIILNLENNIPKKINDKFIYIDDNNLDRKICNIIINRFELDDRKKQGETIIGLEIDIKNSIDLDISKIIEWKDIDEILFKKLNNSLNIYLKILYSNYGVCFNLKDTGYVVKKYKKNEGYYKWHWDEYNDVKSNTKRCFAYIWYLNDVNSGGETVLLNGKIKPTVGKLILFPTTWTYLHKGNIPVSNDKYIISGFLCSKL